MNNLDTAMKSIEKLYLDKVNEWLFSDSLYMDKATRGVKLSKWKLLKNRIGWKIFDFRIWLAGIVAGVPIMQDHGDWDDDY